MRTPLEQKSSRGNKAPLTSKDQSWKSDMIGLPKLPTYKKENSPKVVADYKGKSALQQRKSIVEKGSYEKGKVEKYPSKKAMVKHEKKETKTFEKKEGIKPKSPMKQYKSVIDSMARPKSSPTKMKKC